MKNKQHMYKMLVIIGLCLGSQTLFAVRPAEQAAIFIKQDLNTAWNNLVKAAKSGAKFDPSYEKVVIDKLELLKKTSPDLYNEEAKKIVQDIKSAGKFAPNLTKSITFVNKEGKQLTTKDEERIIETSKKEVKELLTNLTDTNVTETAKKIVAIENVNQDIDENFPGYPNIGNFNEIVKVEMLELDMPEEQKVKLESEIKIVKEQEKKDPFVAEEINQFEDKDLNVLNIKMALETTELSTTTSDTYNQIIAAVKNLEKALEQRSTKLGGTWAEQYVYNRCKYLDLWIDSAKTDKLPISKLKEKLAEASNWVSEYNKFTRSAFMKLIGLGGDELKILNDSEKESIMPLIRKYIFGNEEGSYDLGALNNTSIAGLLNRYMIYVEEVFGGKNFDKNDFTGILFNNPESGKDTKIIFYLIEDMGNFMKAFGALLTNKERDVWSKILQQRSSLDQYVSQWPIPKE